MCPPGWLQQETIPAFGDCQPDGGSGIFRDGTIHAPRLRLHQWKDVSSCGLSRSARGLEESVAAADRIVEEYRYVAPPGDNKLVDGETAENDRSSAQNGAEDKQPDTE